jgi:amphi-Trp domain-containing protein
MPKKKSRDVERTYTAKQFVSKLRRLADAIENGERFRIQVGGERVSVPSDATISVEHERDGKHEEVELQIRWTND